MTHRPPMLGLRHVALWIPDEHFDATVTFYLEGLGLEVDWQPDPDNVYLSSGADNVALHRSRPERAIDHDRSPLDHIGFALRSADDVRGWHDHLAPRADQWGIELLGDVKHHRDGSVSFYLHDPAGHTVQMIYIPSLVDPLRGT
jgi:catechol 2,3-dioxygenase-like lactoylglutathione lyase family enzyme